MKPPKETASAEQSYETSGWGRTVIRAMENAALLSPADVQVIRRYVENKYASLAAGKRAEIVATAIRQTIQRRLPDLPAELNGRIADELIRRCLLGEQREIMPDDVLDVCSGIALPDPSSEFEILDPVLRWMNEKNPGVWSPDKLMTRLFGRKPIPAVFEEAAKEQVAAGLAVEAEYPENAFNWRAAFNKLPNPAWILSVLVLAGGVITGVMLRGSTAEQPMAAMPPEMAAKQPLPDIGMPQAMHYREIDTAAVKDYLVSRESILAENRYFDAIIASAREFDVNPLLLFAITGQEQGFVPKSNKDAGEIANNPFNVYYSWEDYNTDIANSADVAARTISRRAVKRPEGHDPFDWLNITYAEDPNWADGVKRIFDKLSSLSSAP